jgi:acyl-CoA synthetase (NDP forming)
VDPLGAGPRRPAWPELARDRTPYAWDAAAGAALGDEAEGAVRDAAYANAEGANAEGADAGYDDAAYADPAPATLPAHALPERESLARLAAAGVSTIPCVPATSAAAAVAAWRELGGPVAVKLDASGLAHKSDSGGVILGLDDEGAVRAAAERVFVAGGASGHAVRGLLVQPMAPAGLELIVGAKRDAQVGPLVIVGLGGVLAEAIDDIAVALAPIDASSATLLLGRLRSAVLLDGFRGGPIVDRRAVGELVAAVSRLISGDPEIVEIDLNPVIAGAAGAVAVDALIITRAAAAREGEPSGR